MQLRTLALGVATGFALAGMAATGATGPWLDVLDAPAVKSPLAARSLVNGLAIAGPRVVAVGQRGHILVSADAGTSWQQADVPASSDLVALHFPSPERGWAVGHDGIVLATLDGGRSWKRQRDGRPADAEVPLLDVWFADDQEGWAVGAFGTLLHTTDGGAKWESQQALADNPKNLHLYAVRGIGADLYLAGEQGLMLRLDRATGRFRALELPYKGTLFGLAGLGTTVVAHGLRGNVVRSTDGGANWQPVPTGVTAGLVASAVDGGRLLIASQAGHVLVSADGGATFSQLRVERPMPAAALAVAGGRLVLGGPRGLDTAALR